MFHIMHVLGIGIICVAKEFLSLRMVELDNEGILLFYYLFIYYNISVTLRRNSDLFRSFF